MCDDCFARFRPLPLDCINGCDRFDGTDPLSLPLADLVRGNQYAFVDLSVDPCVRARGALDEFVVSLVQFSLVVSLLCA